MDFYEISQFETVAYKMLEALINEPDKQKIKKMMNKYESELDDLQKNSDQHYVAVNEVIVWLRGG